MSSVVVTSATVSHCGCGVEIGMAETIPAWIFDLDGGAVADPLRQQQCGPTYSGDQLNSCSLQLGLPDPGRWWLSRQYRWRRMPLQYRARAPARAIQPKSAP
jgi:hypothetical protein